MKTLTHSGATGDVDENKGPHGNDTGKDIATTLQITLKTAATHRTNILRKLELHSIADLVRYGIRNGIVPA